MCLLRGTHPGLVEARPLGRALLFERGRRLRELRALEQRAVGPERLDERRHEGLRVDGLVGDDAPERVAVLVAVLVRLEVVARRRERQVREQVQHLFPLAGRVEDVRLVRRRDDDRIQVDQRRHGAGRERLDGKRRVGLVLRIQKVVARDDLVIAQHRQLLLERVDVRAVEVQRLRAVGPEEADARHVQRQALVVRIREIRAAAVRPVAVEHEPRAARGPAQLAETPERVRRRRVLAPAAAEEVLRAVERHGALDAPHLAERALRGALLEHLFRPRVVAERRRVHERDVLARADVADLDGLGPFGG
mmetsp:Transcript_19884/g.62309  ORF Transcript_19884/g.62309 Transcript_19884/m.62309 type:complete len:306 (+) Transcript_19884:1024-1941(+)